MGGWTGGELGGPYVGVSGDAWLARFNFAGSLLWTQQFGTAESDATRAVAPDGSGGAFVGGVTLGSLGGPSTGDSDIWLARHDGDGTMLYCGPSVPNSTGQAGSMGTSGSRITQQNDLGLVAFRLPQDSFGYFLTSRSQGLVVRPRGSQGNLCLGAAIGRYVGQGQIKNSGAAGAFDLLLDLTMAPTPTGLVAVQPGDTWNFTAWHRDSVGGSATSNFTDAVSVTFR